jgi:transposase
MTPHVTSDPVVCENAAHSGRRGLAVVELEQLATLRDPRCRKSEVQIAEEFTGHWRDDHLFSLHQALKMYDALSDTIAAYEREVLRHLETMTSVDRRDDQAPPPINPTKAQAIKNRGQDPLRHALHRMSGVDLTTIDAVGVETPSASF